MKFNDDSLMLFDLDSCLDYNTYDSSFQFSDEYVDFTCNDLDNISNSIKPCSLINDIDLFSTNQTNEQNLDFTADFCDFTDSLFSSFNSSSSFNNNSSSFNSSTFYNNSLINMTSQNEASSSSSTFNQQDKREEVKKKLLDLTQRKLNTLCFDTKLRNQVLLKSALKSVNKINDDNLLGTNFKLENDNKIDKNDFLLNNNQLNDDKEIKSRKRNFKSNSTVNLLNEKDLIDDKNQIKKQKLSHLDEFIDENEQFNYNDELTLNNLANCFIKLKTQHN